MGVRKCSVIIGNVSKHEADTNNFVLDLNDVAQVKMCDGNRSKLSLDKKIHKSTTCEISTHANHTIGIHPCQENEEFSKIQVRIRLIVGTTFCTS